MKGFPDKHHFEFPNFQWSSPSPGACEICPEIDGSADFISRLPSTHFCGTGSDFINYRSNQILTLHPLQLTNIKYQCKKKKTFSKFTGCYLLFKSKCCLLTNKQSHLGAPS